MFALSLECLLLPELLPSLASPRGELPSSKAMPIVSHSPVHFTFCFSFVPSSETSPWVAPVLGCVNVQTQDHRVHVCVFRMCHYGRVW